MVLRNKSEENKKGKMMSEFKLPDELVLSSILPLLSMKDVARSSVISHTWLRYWRHTPILTFQNPSSLDTMVVSSLKDVSSYIQVVSDFILSFITWVNKVITNHIGCTVEEFVLVYYLNNTHKFIIDRWVVWALSKHVQRLTLDLTAPLVLYGSNDEEKGYYVLDQTSLCNTTTKLYLTTLCLKCVNVDALTIKYLLDGCASTLENLCIEKSYYLTSITAAASLTCLKSFMVVNCPQLESIHIQAPNLVSLTFNSGWHCVLGVFNIENASKLCYANIIIRDEQRFLFVLSSLFNYFSHLEHLKLKWYANQNMNLALDKFPVLANLKHLEIVVHGYGHTRTLAAWVLFIGACPRLEQLTLEMRDWLLPVVRKNVYQDKCPLRCLKTFEIRGFNGNNVDADIANFVVENGINLQEVIIHPCNYPIPVNLEAPFARVDFELPPHVKLVIVN